MTPIQYILVVGVSVFTVDFANLRQPVATCPDVEGALWLGNSLAAYHSVPLRQANHGLDKEETIWVPTPPKKHDRAAIIDDVADRLGDYLSSVWDRPDDASIIAQIRSYASK